MRISFAIFISVIFISCRDNKPQKTSDSPTYNPAVYLFDKTICENKLSITGQLLSKKQTTYFYQYDAINGDRISDSVVSYRYYEYDQDNNPIHELEFDQPRNKKLKPRYEIIRTYKDTTLLTENEYQDGMLVRFRIHVFDNQNREIKRTIFRRIPPKDYDVNDIISKDRWTYDTIVSINKYNASGQLTLVESYSNNLKSTTDYLYSGGKLNKQIEKDKNGDTLSLTLLSVNNNIELRVVEQYELNWIDSSWRENACIYKMVNYQKDTKQLTETVSHYDKFGHEIESTTKKNYR